MEKESDIQNAICEYLALKRYFFWRQNTAPTVQFSGGQSFYRRMPKFSITGIPDIILIKNGKFIGIEVKRKGGKQSDSQKYFQHNLELAGGEYHIVYSVDDVMKIL